MYLVEFLHPVSSYLTTELELLVPELELLTLEIGGAVFSDHPMETGRNLIFAVVVFVCVQTVLGRNLNEACFFAPSACNNHQKTFNWCCVI